MSSPCPLPLSRKPEVSAAAIGEAKRRQEHAGKGPCAGRHLCKSPKPVSRWMSSAVFGGSKGGGAGSPGRRGRPILRKKVSRPEGTIVQVILRSRAPELTILCLSQGRATRVVPGR